ncbi:MAG TPA: glycosyl hydrolase family 18 protein [Kofleriaceae bacterium]|jgi:chitinase|nr:glycosyl hydrolase family 18 protein [Kofleriaceae bacterium]
MMKTSRWLVLAAMVASAAAPAPASAAVCTGVAAYSATTIYNPNDRAVFNGHLWQAVIQIWNTPPDYCPACNYWQDLGACGSADTTPPTVPGNLTSPSQTQTTISLSWSASTDAGGVMNYDILRNGTVVATVAATSFTDGNLPSNTAFGYAVRARDSAGNVSAASASITVMTLGTTPCTAVPTVPAGLSSPSQTTSSVSLQWSASTAPSCTISYRVFVNGTQNQTSTTTSATVAGLAANTSFSVQVSAVTAAGASALSAPITVRTAANPPPSAHFITGYWQNFNNGALVVKLRDVPGAYNVIAVAFADATATPGAVAFNLDPSLGYSGVQEFKNDIATLHGQGRKVILSIGGQNGTISVASSDAATSFRNSVVDLMNSFGFDGVDIDLENGVNATFMAQALHSIAAAHPGAIITLAPQTIDMQSTGMAYFQLALNIKDVLTVVNMQYYNSGTMLGCDGQVYAEGTINFLTALACIQLQNGLRPDQVGLGLPASTAAAGGGFVDPSVVNAALDCLTTGTNCGSFHPPQRWPGLRGAMTWSINHDGTTGFHWVNTIASHLGAVP